MKKKLTIRPFKNQAELKKIVEIQEQHWGNGGSDNLNTMVQEQEILAIMLKAEVIGYISISDVEDEGYLELHEIVVSEDYRGKGFGAEALVFLKDRYKQIRLFVNTKNVKAVKFYLTHNFRIECFAEHYFCFGRHAYRMIWRESLDVWADEDEEDGING